MYFSYIEYFETFLSMSVKSTVGIFVNNSHLCALQCYARHYSYLQLKTICAITFAQ